MISKIFVFILIFLVTFVSGAKADIIYLRNGRSIEGLITKANDEGVELNIGFGTVKFRREEIESIYKSEYNEVILMRQEWRKQKSLEEERRLKREQKRKQELMKAEKEKELEPKEVEFSQTSGHIIVSTLLNKKVKAALILDTGASLVLLSRHLAEKLGIKTHRGKENLIKVEMADGRKLDARHIVLDSVNVQGVEASDVGAAVLLKDTQMSMGDGLLGMSFLNKFSFQIDTLNKKLILEKQQ